MESSKSDIESISNSGEAKPKPLNIIKSIYEIQAKQQETKDAFQTIEETPIKENRSRDVNHMKKCYNEQLQNYEKAEEAVLSSGKDVGEIIISFNASIDKLSKLIERNRANVKQLTEEISQSTATMEKLKEQADLKTAEIARIQEERDMDKAEFRQLTKGIQETTSQLKSLKQAYTKNNEADKTERDSSQVSQDQLNSIEAQLTVKIDAISSLELNKGKYQRCLESYRSLSTKVTDLAKEIENLNGTLEALKDLKTKKMPLDEDYKKVDHEVRSMEENIKNLGNLREFSKKKFGQAPLHQKLEHLVKIIDTLKMRGTDTQELENECTKVADELIKLRTEGLISTSKEGQEQESFFTMKENIANRIIKFISDGLITENDFKAYKENLEKEKLKGRVIKTEQDLIASQKRLKLYDRLANRDKTEMKEALKFVQQKLTFFTHIDTNTLKEMSANARKYLKHSVIFLSAQQAIIHEELLQSDYHYVITERKLHELLPKLDRQLTDYLKSVEDAKTQLISERTKSKKSIGGLAEQAETIFPSISNETLDAKIKRCGSSILAKQKEKGNIEKNIVNKRKYIINVKANLTRLDAKLERERESAKAFESIQATLKQNVLNNRSNLVSIGNEKLQLEREIRDLGKAIQKLSNEQKLLNIDKPTIDSYDPIMQQLEQYTAAIDGFSHENPNLARKIDKQKKSIDQLKEEKSKLASEIKEYESSIQKSEKQRKSRSRKIMRYRLIIERVTEKINQAKQAIFSNEQRRKEAGEKLDTLKREIEKLLSGNKQYNETVLYKRDGKTIKISARKVGYFDEQGALQIGKMTQDGQLIGENQTLIYLYSHLWDRLYCVGSSCPTRWNG